LFWWLCLRPLESDSQYQGTLHSFQGYLFGRKLSCDCSSSTVILELAQTLALLFFHLSQWPGWCLLSPSLLHHPPSKQKYLPTATALPNPLTSFTRLSFSGRQMSARLLSSPASSTLSNPYLRSPYLLQSAPHSSPSASPTRTHPPPSASRSGTQPGKSASAASPGSTTVVHTPAYSATTSLTKRAGRK